MHDPLFSLAGRRILVTGASSGLGAHFARTLAARGAHVAVAARRVDRLQSLVADIASRGGRAEAFEMDVNAMDSIQEGVSQVVHALGVIDVLVNNSGVSATSPLEEVTPTDFDAVFATNLRGAFFVAQAVARGMIERAREPGTRAIVNVASSAGLRPLPRIGPYAASKAALVHLTRSMAMEWGRHGINANALCPGYIRTELNDAHWDGEAGRRLMARLPRQRLGTAEDLDGTLLLLCSEAGRLVNRAVLAVDDGLNA